MNWYLSFIFKNKIDILYYENALWDYYSSYNFPEAHQEYVLHCKGNTLFTYLDLIKQANKILWGY